MKQIIMITIICLAVATLSSCTPVRAWEKGNLAKPNMQFDPDPLESKIYRHINDSREGGFGGYGVEGGGCGCG